ncbi:MAG: hypothetical protein OXI18_13895 [bacterium]|nr:hypothetical protein [bacterium]
MTVWMSLRARRTWAGVCWRTESSSASLLKGSTAAQILGGRIQRPSGTVACSPLSVQVTGSK